MRQHLAANVSPCLCRSARLAVGLAALSTVLMAGQCTTMRAVTSVSKADDEIAAASAKLAAYCPAIEAGAALAASLPLTGKVKAALAKASIVLGDACSAQPTNILSGALLVERVLDDLRAINAAK